MHVSVAFAKQSYVLVASDIIKGELSPLELQNTRMTFKLTNVCKIGGVPLEGVKNHENVLLL